MWKRMSVEGSGTGSATKAERKCRTRNRGLVVCGEAGCRSSRGSHTPACNIYFPFLKKKDLVSAYESLP